MKLFVGNLSWDATDEALTELFEAYGKVRSCRIVKDPYTQRSKGFGFIEFENEADALAAVNALNEKDFLGRPLRVSQARTEGSRGDDRGPRGGAGGGRSQQRRPFRSRFEENQYT
jgi:RNA recognition motif-containing protein